MSPQPFPVALVVLQRFDIKATKAQSPQMGVLHLLGFVTLIVIALLGFIYSLRRGRLQAEKHMRAAGLKPDRDEEPKGL